MTWWWLSFCDPERPKGSQFLGVVVGEGIAAADVIRECWRRKCNPGGEIAFYEISPDAAVTNAADGDAFSLALVNAPRWRLLSRAELEALGLRPVSPGGLDREAGR